MAELPPRYPSSPLTNDQAKVNDIPQQKGKEIPGYKPTAAVPRPCVSLRACFIPSLIWVGTSRPQYPPQSPLPLVRIVLWKTAQRSARVCICPPSIPSHFPPPSIVSVTEPSTGCSGGRDFPESRPPSSLRRRCTASISRPLGGQTISR